MIAARVVVTHSLAGPRVEKRLLDRGIRALCPMYSREVRHARRTEVKQYPLYSRYMFAWVHDDQLREVLSVNETVDVLRRAGNSKSLAIVPDAIIRALTLPDDVTEFKEGDEVTVAHGQWQGLNGLFSKRESDRVTILFSMLGHRVPYDLHYTQIRMRERLG